MEAKSIDNYTTVKVSHIITDKQLNDAGETLLLEEQKYENKLIKY